jgi:hypothetical protein
MKEKGAITVFLALIFMSLIIFAGTVIDIVRITAAGRKVQSALNSSARSVLAGYDSELIGSYGIYGVNTGDRDIKEDFYRYMIANLEERHENINFIDIGIDYENVEIQGMNSLLNDKAFKKQVQEYMKYRTPIKLADTIIEQLQNIKLDKKVDFVKSEKATRNMARELRSKTNEVNSRLAGIKKKLEDLSVEKLEEIKNELSDTLSISGSIYDKETGGLLDDYIKSREETNDKAEEGGCIGNQSREFENIQENSKDLTPGIQRYLSEVNKTLLNVRPLQKESELLREKLSKLKDELDESEDEDDISEIQDDIDNTENEIGQLESEIDEEISELKIKLGKISLEGYSLKNESVWLDNKNMAELKSFIDKTKKQIEEALLKRLEKDWLITAGEFENGNLILGEDFGKMDENSHFSPSMEEEEAERSNNEIIKNMERLADSIDKAASSAMEKVNTIEYVMDKYTFLTSKTERSHYFGKGEVEYIISGSDVGGTYSTIKSTEYYIVTEVLLQVWALRFAIDAVDDFISSPIVFPPQRLAFALAEGALDSSLDMFNMLNGEGVSLCPKSCTEIKLKYSDHLKILLLLKPEEEILRKARQLMQVNIKQVVDADTGLPRKDFRLGDYSTVISVGVEAKMNLFFLPLLKIDRLMPGSFEDGRYIIRKQMNVGY